MAKRGTKEKVAYLLDTLVEQSDFIAQAHEDLGIPLPEIIQRAAAKALSRPAHDGYAGEQLSARRKRTP